MKRDGHTHSEYCPHGRIGDTEELILAAAAQGFTHYSVTEHSPMPEDFFRRVPEDLREEARRTVMRPGDLEHYLGKMHRLKEKYRDRIALSVGLEVEYVEAFAGWTRDLLDEYGPQLDDGLVSVHYLALPRNFSAAGPGGKPLPPTPGEPEVFLPMDLSYDLNRQALLPALGGPEGFRRAYFGAVRASAQADLGRYGPKRLGHISLCQKFDLALPQEERGYSPALEEEILRLLGAAKERGFALDFNVAGLRKPQSPEFYPGRWIARRALALGIPLVYGSDSHHVSEVGLYYDVYRQYAQ